MGNNIKHDKKSCTKRYRKIYKLQCDNFCGNIIALILKYSKNI